MRQARWPSPPGMTHGGPPSVPARPERRIVAPCFRKETGARDHGLVDESLASVSIRTRATPRLRKASISAACEETSITRPRTKGPRSLMVTSTERPLSRFVTLTDVPKGRVRCAAVKLPAWNLDPLAVLFPDMA